MEPVSSFDSDERWMREALLQAERALSRNEVPIGALVVLRGRLLGAAGNEREDAQNPFAHAEVLAIQRAAALLGSWHLDGAELFVTVEPCPMCAGAILMAGFSRCVYGASNPRVGCAGTKLNLLDYPGMGKSVQVRGGIMAKECSALVSSFFVGQRRGGD